MVGGAYRRQQPSVRVQGVVEFFRAQDFLPAQKDELLVLLQAQYLVHRQQLAFAHRMAFAVLGRPFGQLHFVVDFGIGTVGNGDFAGAVGDQPALQ